MAAFDDDFEDVGATAAIAEDVIGRAARWGSDSGFGGADKREGAFTPFSDKPPVADLPTVEVGGTEGGEVP